VHCRREFDQPRKQDVAGRHGAGLARISPKSRAKRFRRNPLGDNLSAPCGYGSVDICSVETECYLLRIQPFNALMSRTYLTFGDIARKLHVLRIECTRCARRGQYSVAKLIAQHGHRGNMSKWVSDLRGDCSKRNAPQLHERCDLICPDLAKVL
jgi:hypothetical protein